MPRASAMNQSLQRFFVYGPGKMKKTWWCLKAAEVGYNVLLIDADAGSAIKDQLSPEAQERIYIVEAMDTETKATAARFMAAFCKEFSLYWDEERKDFSFFPTETTVGLHLAGETSRVRSNLLLVVDSWTALCRSIDFEYALKNNIDLSDAEKTDWDGYGLSGRIATWMLSQIKAAPCHTVVIGHDQIYEKYQGSGKDRKLLESRTQPISTSGPHGKRIAKEYDNMLLFYREGLVNWIDVDGNRLKDAGSRQMAPGKYKWDDVHIGSLLGPVADTEVINWETLEKPRPQAPQLNTGQGNKPRIQLSI